MKQDEIDNLYTQFDKDANEYMAERDWLADYEEDADKHALRLAIERERAAQSEAAKLFFWLVDQLKVAGLHMSGKHHYRLDTARLPRANSALDAIREGYAAARGRGEVE